MSELTKIDVAKTFNSLLKNESVPSIGIIATRFLDMAVDYSDDGLQADRKPYVPEHLEADQIEDWLIGQAVLSTLDNSFSINSFAETASVGGNRG